MQRTALLVVLLALSPFLMAESCDDWFSSDHPSTLFAGGSFEAVQLASGAIWRITFRDESSGSFSSVRVRIDKDGQLFKRLTLREGGVDFWDVGPGEVLDHDWRASQNLLDDRGNPLLPEDQPYTLQVRP